MFASSNRKVVTRRCMASGSGASSAPPWSAARSSTRCCNERAPSPRGATVSGRQAALVLEDGTVFVGRSFGAEVNVDGEVVFNTGMTGYQEISTDPSYRGQMVVLTHPQVGNYGVSRSAAESARPLLTALIVRELADFPNHWESDQDLSAYLKRWDVPGLEGIDTRALTRRLRSRGTLRAVLRHSGERGFSQDDLGRLAEEAREVTPLSEKLLIPEVSGITPPPGATTARGSKVVLVDYGYKANIARSLQRRGALVELLPWDAGFEGIVDREPDAIVLSNGPGDPAQLADAVATTRKLIPTGVPI